MVLRQHSPRQLHPATRIFLRLRQVTHPERSRRQITVRSYRGRVVPRFQYRLEEFDRVGIPPLAQIDRRQDLPIIDSLLLALLRRQSVHRLGR